MAVQRTTAEIEAELAEFRTARAALINGERVKDVSRDGRRMAFSEMSLKDIDAAIAALVSEYNTAVAVADGLPRRRAISLGY